MQHYKRRQSRLFQAHYICNNVTTWLRDKYPERKVLIREIQATAIRADPCKIMQEDAVRHMAESDAYANDKPGSQFLSSAL
jgi:hypothetical protein